MNKKLLSYASSGLLLAALAFNSSSVAQADEGMFLFNDPPTSQLKSKYNFELTPDWLNYCMLAAVRFNNGGSGGFVSNNGLVITNHHIADEVLAKLSTPEKDLIANGFLAHNQSEELRSPNLELNCLQSIEDVTDKVNAAIKKGMTAEEAGHARRARMTELERASLEATGLRSDVVTLYQGARYHLYRYKKYTDVRLVWAPEQAIASFGGDVDNFEYPRRALDVALFRVYENGKPVKPEHYFPVQPAGPDNGELVFVVGHPGTTNRLETVARLEHLRDFSLPYRLARVRSLEAALLQFAERGSEEARQADNDIHSVANSRKAYTGMFNGLLNRNIMERKRAQERLLKAQASRTQAWDTIAQSQQSLQAFEAPYALLEQQDALASQLFTIARHLVRLAAEEQKPNGDRLREYRNSNLESLKQKLFDASVIYPEVQKVRLTSSLSFLAEQLGAENPDAALILQGQSPDARANMLVAGTKLADVEVRRALYQGGQKAIDESNDSMLVLARSIDARSRQLRKLYENQVVEPELEAYAQIAQERFRINGAANPPDATFTLRLSYGVVKGYTQGQEEIPWCTHFADAYTVHDSHQARAPYCLPDSWLKARSEVNPETPMVFVATSDTIGGNSGSPVVNKKGQLVGVNFDRNQHGMVRNFVYDEARARHMSVSTPALLESLANVYHADSLVKELKNSAQAAKR